MSITWAKSEYSKNEVCRAGETLIKPMTDIDEFIHAMDVLSNWRAAHAYPMHALLIFVRNKASKIDSSSIVVQRLKRTPSILDKLSRYAQMKLHRMQDIGGCRAIVKTVSDVEKLSDNLSKSRTRHKLHKIDNYIDKPKESGYRGVHLVYKYNGDKESYKDYFVEVQLRSKIQHTWATAVEIVDTFTKQALKSSKGDKKWQDFFTYVSAELAKMEKRPLGENARGIDTKSEVIRLAEELNVINLLNAFTVSTDHIISNDHNKSDYFLLELKDGAKQIYITKFEAESLEIATQTYLDKEKQAKDNPDILDVVLVSANSMRSLRSAYPNYFADSKGFIKNLTKIITN